MRFLYNISIIVGSICTIYLASLIIKHIKKLKDKIEVKKTIGMDNPFNYRNKAQYPVGLDKQGNPVIGVFANRTHEVIEIKECMIQNKESEKIAKYICEFAKRNNLSVYNEETRKGLLRHIVIKVGMISYNCFQLIKFLFDFINVHILHLNNFNN